jgi:hypothetical protein
MRDVAPESDAPAEASFNDPREPFALWAVAMPIIRLMRDGQLSWAQREECAWALQEAIRQHRSLMDERLSRQMAAVGGKAA